MMLIFAVLRLSSAAKGARRRLRDTGSETALLSMALQDAVSKLKAQEHAMSIRAIASEQLNGQIVESLAAGLLVVDRCRTCRDPQSRRSPPARGARRRRAAATTASSSMAPRNCRRSSPAVWTPTRRWPADAFRSIAGGVTHLSVTVSPLAAAANGSEGAICLFSDLTPVIELEEQLRLKEALARVGELTAGIAHEFRNGLATIHGYSRLIRPDDLPPAYRPYVDGIRQETEALGHVVTNFLNFARPEQVVCATVELEPVIARGRPTNWRTSCPRTPSSTSRASSASSTATRCCCARCSAICFATPPRPVRRPACHRTSRCWGTWTSAPAASWWTTTARACPSTARSKIFQPFFTTRSRGTGLGLAIVLKLVVTHNGRVAVAASPLGGASFQLTFPLRTSEAETLTPEAVEIG